MERPDDKKGALVIRTKFGEMSAEPDINFDKTAQDMSDDEAWLQEVGADGGIFCYTNLVRVLPF